ncbi:putative involucrin repeat protein [Erysiphe neolycopersici]|uniref:Putative involucrin repeat protein n=1 Tax=Erysiphe neolycopersici TaxID=212602 RepID=A0A420I499_9PEZI|nr:putative involucrin repeat protein [Erysiphe neolycopersici]
MISGTPTKSHTPLFRPNLSINSRPSYDPEQGTYIVEPNKYTNESLNQGSYFSVSAEEHIKNLQEPSANVALEGYRNDLTSEIRGEKLWPVESKGAPSENFSMVDSIDPIQILILVETALYDSRDFEILSPEEVEVMKVKCDTITKRIEQTRKDLMIQSKYSDATITVAKLYSSKLSNELTPEDFVVQREDQARQNEQEYRASERRCEELAINLFRLEKELMITQGRLLKHTARILHMNYEETKDSRKPFDTTDGMYTFMDKEQITKTINDDFLFDERSLYRALEGSEEESYSTGKAPKVQAGMISRIEQKLEALNDRAKKITNQVDLNAAGKYEPPRGSNENSESLEIVEIYLEFLEQSMKSIEYEQEKLSNQYSKISSQNKNLMEEKEILQRQIQQQRDLNSHSSSSKEIQLSKKTDELAKMIESQAKNLNDIDNLGEQASSLSEKLFKTQQKETLQDQLIEQKSSDLWREADERTRLAEEKIYMLEERVRKADETSRVTLTEIKNRDKSISKLEEQLQRSKNNCASAYTELETKTTILEAQIKSLRDELTSVASAKARLDIIIQEKEKQLEDKKREIYEAQMDIARLQTEVTIAKTELDSAYGSRAQRAAQVALNPVIQKEIDRLTSINNLQISEIIVLKAKLADIQAGNDEIVKQLRNELTETIEEYEKMTRASIEWEKERGHLEETIDSLRDAKENIEAQFNDEKVQWIGVRSSDAELISPNSTSTAVLKNEFKKMIRDIRAENAKVLKAEQSERRRLEEELRGFRRSQLNPTLLNAL